MKITSTTRAAALALGLAVLVPSAAIVSSAPAPAAVSSAPAPAARVVCARPGGRVVCARPAAACSLYAERPEYIGAAINGWGHWSGCPTSAKVSIVLRQDRSWWPDRTLASTSGSGSFGSRVVAYACGNDFDPIKVFVEVRYNGQKAQSPRAVLPCG